MIITDPAAAITRYIDAVRDGDSSAIRECFAEDAIWEYPGDLPLSGTWRGRDTIVDDFLGTVGPALEPGSSVALEVTNVLSVGDQVAAEWTSDAISHAGMAYHNRNVGIFTVKNGKITSVREYTDTLHAARAFFPELIQGLSETQQLPDTGANCGPEAAALCASRHSRRSARSAGAPETRSRRCTARTTRTGQCPQGPGRR